MRAKSLAKSALVCLGRRTVTGMLATSGRQFQDWSAAYRLFRRERMDMDAIFAVILGRLAKELPPEAPLAAALDDTILKKSGNKTAGVAYRRDPLGPPFRTNFIRGQRFVQISAAIFEHTRMASAKMVPIRLQHAPTPQKPKEKASDQERLEYRQLQNQQKISRIALQSIHHLRKDMDQNSDLRHRRLVVSVDGSYTNETCLKHLPERTTLIGRIRKDAKLHFLPQRQPKRGRKMKYGPLAPTPEELRQDNERPYTRVAAFSAGKLHDFRVKAVGPVRWRKAGGDIDLQLLIIAPLGYRLTKNSKLLYRRPAYLICTDPNLPIEELLQLYLWRWGIEVNFRDQKTILGMGQAQVRTQDAVQAVPALIAAAYAILLIAAKRAFGPSFTSDQALPKPKWQNYKAKTSSTQKLINHLKAEMWGTQLGLTNFSLFRDKIIKNTQQKKGNPNLESAIFYSNN